MFDLSQYEQVKDRIKRFYSDHVDGSITTELVTKPESIGIEAAFKASCFVAGRLISTGYAYEAKGQGVNKDAWVENAETSAIGRALANMDYCGTLRPSREEMNKTDVAKGQPEYTLENIKSNIRAGLTHPTLTELDVEGYKNRIASFPKIDEEVYKAELMALSDEIQAEIKSRSDTRQPAFHVLTKGPK